MDSSSQESRTWRVPYFRVQTNQIFDLFPWRTLTDISNPPKNDLGHLGSRRWLMHLWEICGKFEIKQARNSEIRVGTDAAVEPKIHWANQHGWDLFSCLIILFNTLWSYVCLPNYYQIQPCIHTHPTLHLYFKNKKDQFVLPRYSWMFGWLKHWLPS